MSLYKKVDSLVGSVLGVNKSRGGSFKNYYEREKIKEERREELRESIEDTNKRIEVLANIVDSASSTKLEKYKARSDIKFYLDINKKEKEEYESLR